jgi:hypothetical protein
MLLISNIGTLEGLTAKQIQGIETSMTLFAVQEIGKFKTREITGTMTSFFKLVMNFSWDNTVLYIRYRSFLLAKRQARIQANIQNRKYYIIRSSLIGYKVLSTMDIDLNKRVRILDKHITAKNLHEKADAVVMPKK